MVQTRTPRQRKNKRCATFRGGTVETVARVIGETPIGDQLFIINQASKFVVATYWWGRANQNRNLQYPCPEDIMDIARKRTIELLTPRFIYPQTLVDNVKTLREIGTRPYTEYEKNLFEATKTELRKWKTKILESTEGRAKLREFYDQAQAEEQAKPGSRPIRGFPEMIAEWEAKCRAANVNFISLNTEFDRSDYQNGINGKPLFIKKILDLVKPRAVLYIDGDMWMHKYPHIFDIDNVDFMARGWNVDSRAKERAMLSPYYDPYTFETSGGTMYFGNTQRARDLLDKWSLASSKPEAAGKADDRILSQLITTRSLMVETNVINLPIEYLWLTDLYKGYLRDASTASSIEDAYIEHPYCLTGEERAADQGAAVSREPVGYEEEVNDNINYKRDPEPFYEYVFFDGNQQMRDGFDRYLRYMSTARNGWTQNPLIQLVGFADRYGEFNPIADRNLEGLVPTPANEPTNVRLPLGSTVKDILKVLLDGNNVVLGTPFKKIDPEDEFVAVDATTGADGIDMYTRRVRINTDGPMFISGKNRIIKHLLTMCDTLADINKHAGTFTFLSRIRWRTVKDVEKPSGIVAARNENIDFNHYVHQIWFGADMPDWRKKMFAYNKAVCEAHGFEHKLWTNAERNAENFEITLAYQDAALEAGRAIGQNRWAQVADLARLELVYNNGGIYIDSLFEITPAFLAGVVAAIQSGKTFVGCNEDPCDPPLDCLNGENEVYLTNSFFAATRGNPILKQLLTIDGWLDEIDMEVEEINHTTGPYYLRRGITPEFEPTVFLFDSSQIYQFNAQPSRYKPATPNRFLFRTNVPGSIKVRDGMYFLQGGIETLQQEFILAKKGPLATYHSGLGGTWST
jgi:hypothetical protein